MVVLSLILACTGGNPTPCRELDTGDTGDTGELRDRCGSAESDTDTDADADADADTDADTDLPASGFTAQIVVSNGDTRTFTGGLTGEFDDSRWGFAVIGSPPTNTFGMGFAAPGGTGTFTTSDNEGDSPASYSDFSWGVTNSGFVGLSGTTVVTAWEPATQFGQPGARITGTFVLDMTNSPDPTDPADVPLTLTATGSFVDVFLFETQD
ncbi:MAG: hypothetical protein R3F61_33265 [Myxococcota bacterium]